MPMDRPFIPAPNNGLIQASTLLNTGIQGIGQAITANSDRERAENEQETGLMAKGWLKDSAKTISQTDPVTGETKQVANQNYGHYKRDPVSQAAFDQAKEESDGGSETSANYRSFAAAAIAQTNPALSEQIKNSTMSAQQIKQYDAQFGGLLQKQATGAATGARIKNSQETGAQGTVNKDHVLTTYLPRLDGAQKILNLMDAAEAGGFKTNQAMLGQLNAEISRLETGSQSPGLNASEKTEMQDSAAKMHDFIDTLTGGVTGVDLKAKFDQARGMVTDLGKSYFESVNKRLNFLKSGAPEGVRHIYDDKSNEFNSSYASFGKSNGLVKSGGAVKSGDQSDPKVSSWAQDHGLDYQSALKILKSRGYGQ